MLALPATPGQTFELGWKATEGAAVVTADREPLYVQCSSGSLGSHISGWGRSVLASRPEGAKLRRVLFAIAAAARSARPRALCAVSILSALTFVVPATAQAQPYPYTLVEPGTFGGPQSFLDLPAVPLTPQGTLLGAADTSTLDADYPNFNPLIGPNPYVAHAFEWRGGRLRDLGALPGNNTSSVFEVNGAGVGVGASEATVDDPFTGSPAEHAVMYVNGEVRDLGTLPGGYESQANDINDRGQVSGFASNGTADPYALLPWGTQSRSFIWQHGVMRDIGTLGGPDAVSTTLNARGQIAGQSYINSTANPATGVPTLDPFLWQNGRMRDLGTLGGTMGVANWLNDAGEVVGSSSLAGDHTTHPFLWKNGTMRDLGTLGGDKGAANWVNARGDVAGDSRTADQNFNGFLWRDGTMIDLPPVGGAAQSFAIAVNDRDQVVGKGTDADFNEMAAVLWASGRAYDLNTLVAPSALQMTSAFYINAQGDIVGHGVLPDGSQRVFLLTPNGSVPLPRAPTSARPLPTTGLRDGGTPALTLALHGPNHRGAAATVGRQLVLSQSR